MSELIIGIGGLAIGFIIFAGVWIIKYEYKRTKLVNEDLSKVKESLDNIIFLARLRKATGSGMLADWAEAAEIDIHDPMFSNMSVTEAFEIISVRIADRKKRAGL